MKHVSIICKLNLFILFNGNHRVFSASKTVKTWPSFLCSLSSSFLQEWSFPIFCNKWTTSHLFILFASEQTGRTLGLSWTCVFVCSLFVSWQWFEWRSCWQQCILSSTIIQIPLNITNCLSFPHPVDPNLLHPRDCTFQLMLWLKGEPYHPISTRVVWVGAIFVSSCGWVTGSTRRMLDWSELIHGD